jgi:hypothetical protein
MSERTLKESIAMALENAEYIGRIKAQNEILHLVWELSKQGRISNDVAQVFALELSLDLPTD